MPETLNLNYYYGNEADQYSFYRIPKILLTDRRYKGVSLEAKVLYGLLLDRMGLSARNGWLDDNGRVFLYFTQEEVMTMLDCGKDKATKLFRELEGIGLVERKKQGQGHPARIYVKNFILEPEHSAPVQTAENQQSRPLDSAAVKTAEKPQSARRKTSGQECGISAPNNTDINKTEKSDTDLSITPPAPSAVSSPAGKRAPRRMGLDEMESYRELILENIDYDILLERNPWDKDLLDGYVELMLEICCSTRESVRICGQEVPTEVVKSRFLKLNSEHIGYVMDSLKSNTAKIGNIKAFESTAKKYGIDFALKKDATESPPRYLVFFKGRDADVLTAAFKEFSAKKLTQEKKPSIRKLLSTLKEAAQGKNAERAKVKNKDREVSL